MTIRDYKNQYPDSPILDKETSDKISNQLSGRERSQAHKDALSATISAQYTNGRKANKGKLGKKDSPETLERKRIARTGKTHTQETKDKIGNAHRGKVISQEAIDKCQATKRARIEEFGPYTPGIMSPEVRQATNDKLSEIARNRTPEQVAEKVRLMNEARRGQIISSEQRITYRNARLKYMAENPDKLPRRMFDTVPELEFEKELQALGIPYSKQYHTRNPHFLYDFKVGNNVLIEIDGPYHRNPDLFPDKEEFIYKQQIDALKDLAAEALGFYIFRIPVGQHLPDDWNSILINQGCDLTRLDILPEIILDEELQKDMKEIFIDLYTERSERKSKE